MNSLKLPLSSTLRHWKLLYRCCFPPSCVPSLTDHASLAYENVRKDHKGMSQKESQTVSFFFSWLLSQLHWHVRTTKVTHIILKFSYTVDPQGKTHLQTIRVQMGVNENFSAIWFASCLFIKALFTPMCVSSNAKLWPPDAPRAFRAVPSSAYGRRVVLVFSICLDFQRHT